MQPGYQYKSPDYVPVKHVTCQCGQILLKGFAESKKHRTSVFHRQHRRIKKLLASSCVSFTEIGARVGVRSERIRQIADALEIKGHLRQKICTLGRRAREIEQARLSDATLQNLRRVAESQLIKLELLPVEGTSRFECLRLVYLNGHLCRLAAAGFRRGKFITVRPLKITRDVEFAIYWQESTNLWLIFPRKNLPAGRTMFAIEPAQVGGNGKRHDWRDYIDVWDSLKTDAGV
ncbi:MAG TPA: hypothetical protein VHD88_07765 [Pyrinomonadaceae bacterium]|nr:hypothetical protein [Pyrinomonadaceae bacterium]